MKVKIDPFGSIIDHGDGLDETLSTVIVFPGAEPGGGFPSGYTIVNYLDNGNRLLYHGTTLIALETAPTGPDTPQAKPYPQLEITYGGAKSYQPASVDLTLEAAAGGTTGKFLGAIMGHLFGDALTKAGNYLGGLIGHYGVTGVKATTYPAGAVLAGIDDGVTDADGAVVAYIDGDSTLTHALAAFKVKLLNSIAGSGFDFGVDLSDPAHDGYPAVTYRKGEIRMLNDVCIFSHAGVPVDGVAGTGVGFAGPGSQCVDVTNKNVYINANTKASPTWKLVTRAA